MDHGSEPSSIDSRSRSRTRTRGWAHSEQLWMKTEQGEGWVEQPCITHLLCAKHTEIKINNAQFLPSGQLEQWGKEYQTLCGTSFVLATLYPAIWRYWAILVPFYKERRDVKTWSCNSPTLSFFLNEKKIQGKNSHGNGVPYASLIMLNMFPFIFRKHHGHSFITAIWAPGKVPWVFEILSLSSLQICLYHFPKDLRTNQSY